MWLGEAFCQPALILITWVELTWIHSFLYERLLSNEEIAPKENNWAKNRLIWKDPDAGKDWKREEKGVTGWDGWTASPTQWTWVWVNSRSWWWTGRPGVLQSVGSQRVGQTERLNWNQIMSFPSQSPANSCFLWNEWDLTGFYILESMSPFFGLALDFSPHGL